LDCRGSEGGRGSRRRSGTGGSNSGGQPCRCWSRSGRKDRKERRRSRPYAPRYLLVQARGQGARILSLWVCVSLTAVTAASRSVFDLVVVRRCREPSNVLPLAVAMAASVCRCEAACADRCRDADVGRSSRRRRQDPQPCALARGRADPVARRRRRAARWAGRGRASRSGGLPGSW